MTRPTVALFGAAALLLLGAHPRDSAAQPGSAPGTPTVRKLAISMPGRVADVIWTVQNTSSCTARIDLLPSVRNGEKPPEYARTQVWLLNSDGTVMTQIRKPFTAGVSSGGFGDHFTIYTFDCSAEQRPVSLVASIDDQFFVQALPR